MTTPISHVSDTARWVAIYRAMESERSDAIFRDPYARRLGGAQGEAIVRHMPKGAAFAWPMIVRTAVMDEIILRCVQGGAGTVLNLAAGLDTRPYRLDLPPALRWLHVDLPDMIAYVQGQMAGERARCALEYVATDLTQQDARRAVFARAAAGTAPALAIAEGLLVYLMPEQVGALAEDLHAQSAIRWWLIDLASPRLVKMVARQWGGRLAAGNAPWRFAPEEGTAFFEKHGWREAEFRSTWDESVRLKRMMKGAWLWRLLSKLQSKKRHEEGRRMAGIVLLERR
jgi:methyltransferase (TIGR00027 family)